MIHQPSSRAFLALSMALAAASGCSHRSAPAVPRPNHLSLLLTPRVLDLGSVRLGESLPFRATLTNQGDERCTVQSLNASCGCMNVQLDKPTCGPGESLQLTGMIRTGQSPGSFRHAITIAESTNSDHVHLLEVIGRAESQLRVPPDTAVLSPHILDAMPAHQDLWLYNNTKDVIALQDPVGLPEGVTAILEAKTIKPSSRVRLSLTADPSHLTPLHFDLRLLTTSPVCETSIVPVGIVATDGIQIAPSAIRLGVQTRSDLLQSKPLRIHLAGPLLNRCGLAGVQSPPYLLLEKQQSPAQQSITLAFRFTDAFRGLDLGGDIVILLRHTQKGDLPPTERVLHIPISGLLDDS